jgi:bZIP transcription factor
MSFTTAKKQKLYKINMDSAFGTSMVSDESGSDDDDPVPSVIESASAHVLPKMVTVGSNTLDSSNPNIATTNMNSSHYQKKYEPTTSQSMSKMELSQWRKQQRQQRNRISAAASRYKQKSRITELEQQVHEYQQKFASVQKEIERFQKLHVQTPSSLRPDGTTSKEVSSDVISQQGMSSLSTISLDSLSYPIVTSSSRVSGMVNGNLVPSVSSSLVEAEIVSTSKAPFKMISRQALSQELSFTKVLSFLI